MLGARAAVAAMACMRAVAVVLVALAEADGARATVPGEDAPASTHQQGSKGGIDPALEKSLKAAFEKSFKESGVPGAIVGVRTPEGTWVRSLGVADRASGQPM
ncbi:MAG TPA: hypothetical protein VFG99_01045, partial [Chloroflexia bacterium]|nr:hypothetical protein [Chloroflexia bacterium]